jgi:hypothetical protein
MRIIFVFDLASKKNFQSKLALPHFISLKLRRNLNSQGSRLANFEVRNIICEEH